MNRCHVQKYLNPMWGASMAVRLTSLDEGCPSQFGYPIIRRDYRLSLSLAYALEGRSLDIQLWFTPQFHWMSGGKYPIGCMPRRYRNY